MFRSRADPRASTRGARVCSLLWCCLGLGLALASGPVARAQSRDTELPAAPRGRVQDSAPSMTQPLALLLPGAVALTVGTFMLPRAADGTDAERWENTSIGLMIGGSVLMASSLPYFGARLTQRMVWQQERKWSACASDYTPCKPREPKVYPPTLMLVPGAVLAITGATLLAIDPTGSGNSSWPGPDEGRDTEHYRATGIALLTVGSPLLVAGAMLLAIRVQRRAAWRRRYGAARGVDVGIVPSVRPALGATRSYGLSLSGRF
jgi:hypothetical protein